MNIQFDDQLDLFQFISWQIRTLKFLGIWFYIPYPVKTLKFILAILGKIVFALLAFIIPTGGQIIYLLRLVISGKAEIQAVAGMINLILTELLIIIKLLNLHLNRERFSKLTTQLVDEHSYNFSKGHIKSVKKSIQLSRWLYISLLASCGLDIAVHVLVVPSIYGFQILPVKMSLVYIDVNDDTYFKYVFAYQVLYKPFILVAFVAMKTLSWACVIFTTNQLDNICYDIKNMKNSVKLVMEVKHCGENEAFEHVFKNCVRHHNFIVSFVESIQSTFGGQFSLTLIFNACIICTTSVQFFSIESPSNNISELIWVFAFMFIFAVILFIDSYYGDAITTKNFELSKAIYAYTWMDLSSEQKRNVQLFIGKTQKPLLVKTSVLLPVSLKSFTMVMNWTYKGFAVLNQMKT